MKNRSYLGDGVYVSFDGKDLLLELETGRGIRLNSDNWRPLLDFVRLNGIEFDGATIVELPRCEIENLQEVVAEINELYEERPMTKN